MKTPQKDRNAYWRAIADDTRDRVGACGNANILNQMLKIVNRSATEVLLEPDESRWEERSKEVLNHTAP